jgi:segregation and condensation protein B
MELKELESAIISVLFASGEAISLDKLSESVGADKSTVSKVVSNLKDIYDSENRGIIILRLGDSFQLSTPKENAPYVRAALESKRNTPLSPAAFEVLAIIAYNQPVTKGFVEQVRGVSSSEVVNNLVDKGLVEEAGRLDLPGKPISYKTTSNFLRCFGIESLNELPELPSAADAADALEEAAEVGVENEEI